MTPAPALRTLQRWFATVVQHPATAEVAVRTARAQRFVPLAKLRAGGIVAANPRMAATEQLQVYNGGYLVRLVEVMAADFGGVQHALGEEAFAALVERYVARHPSTHPNLNRLGGAFPAFVRRQRRLPDRGFIADLAALEWAMCRAFDAPEFTPMPLAQLEAVPPADWPQARFVANPSLQLVAARFPANAWFQAWKDGRRMRVPAPMATWTAVFRRDGRVWRQTLSRGAFAILRAVCAGTPLAEALARGRDVADVGSLFRGFASDGLFSDLRTSSSAP